MNIFFFSILSILVLVVSSGPLLRLNTRQSTRLNINQSIISTLGLFKTTLRRNCSLQIFSFQQTQNIYQSKGFYNSPLLSKSSCSFLQIKQGKLITSQNQTFLSLSENTYNQSTIFTIDDVGVIRIIGTYIKSSRTDQQSIQKNITSFYIKNKYVYAGTQLLVRFSTNLGVLQNQKGWLYSAIGNGQLDIKFKQNQDMIKSYVYSGLRINNSQLIDMSPATFPASIWDRITYQPRCFQPRIYLNYKAPFIIMADPYWPRVTVLQQGGYKIFQQSYSRRSQFYNQQQQKDIHYIRYFGMCPDEMFQYKGKCVTKCPQPYYHEMRGKIGVCRLVCEEYTPVDQVNKICTCMNGYEAYKYNSQIVISCPSNSIKYPYGCYCSDKNMFFDKKLTFSCVQNCPLTTFAYSGLCVDCPANCNNCSIDGFGRRFLECRVCENGYDLDDGNCFKKCNTNLGEVLVNGTCKNCTDSNCVDCVQSVDVCKKCALMYTLSNGKCLKSCSSSDQIVPAQLFSSVCITKPDPQCASYLSSHYLKSNYLVCDQCPDNKIPYNNRCVTTCPQNFTRYEYGGWPVCSCKPGSLMINNKCYTNMTGCPIKMGFDFYSHSCLSCPFGCLTCVRATCTSCNPGYFLYISPQAIICRRQSPLFSCNQQYSLWNGICLVKQFQTLLMTKCRQNIQNCRVCRYDDINICVACELNYFMFNNTCIKTCPNNHIVYKNISCIMGQIDKCIVPHLQSIKQFSKVNITFMEQHQSYKYYIFNGLEVANDPVGYIPYFQNITSRKFTDRLLRQNSFFEPFWTCLKCFDGYGLSQDFKSCLPCTSPCKLCYMARSNSCLSPELKCQGYIDYVTKTCIKSCNSSQSYPQLIGNILYCVLSDQSTITEVNKIDSAIYLLENGSKLAYFVFEDEIVGQANVTVKIKKAVYRQPVNEQAPKIVAASQITQKVVPLNNNNYFQILSKADQDVFIADFSSSIYQLKSTQGYYPPNLVYGSTTLNTHPQFMKTWLAIIGNIMSFVIIIMHCVYIGNQLLYKMDNLIILTQTIYYFSFVKILVGRLLAQYYYGWIFAHGGWFVNFFKFHIPQSYRENNAPVSYKLATIDTNFIRNAGFSFSLLIIYVGVFLIIGGLVYLLSRLFNKKQIWYKNVFRLAFFAGVEFFSMNIIYWAIAHLLYRGNCVDIYCDKQFYHKNLILAVVFIGGFAVYTLIRLWYDKIGGLYMVKRVVISAVLAGAFNNNVYLAILIAIQLIFTIGRYRFQKPGFKKQKIIILVELIAFIIVYCLLFLSVNAGVNTIIISIIIFVMIVGLMSDFMQVYLESINQWELEADNKLESVGSNMGLRAQTANNLNVKKKK